MQQLQCISCTKRIVLSDEQYKPKNSKSRVKTTVCRVYVDEVIPIRPVLLVHEPQSMEEFVHEHQQAVLLGEAPGVQEHLLLPTYHTHGALALGTSLYHHIVSS